MAGLRRTGRFLAIVFIPCVLSGCASTNSRLAKSPARSAVEQEQTWARAQACEKDGRYPEAQQLYAELCRRDPQSATYAHRLGVVATMSGDHERAAAAYSRARELAPNNAELLTDMGYAAYLRQNYAEAETLLRSALELSGDNPRATSNLALAVGFQGRYDECLALFREVHGQDEAEVLCNLAYVKSQCGDKAEAAALYQQVLAIDPHVKKATVAIAALKAAEAKPSTVASEKPYRKYMNQNAPTVAQVQPVAKPDAAPESQPAQPEIALASQDVVQGQEPAAVEDRTLTDWGSEDAIAPAQVAMAEKRMIPEDDASITPQSVSTEEEPFAVAEADTPATPVLPDEVDAAFEEPEELEAEWAAVRTEPADTFGPEWLASRQEQIAARRGQTGFMGFCPVALRDEQKLVDSLPQYTAEYQSQTYQFSTEEAQRKFAAQPERYLPAAGGLDVVAVSQGTAVAQGSLEHALWFRHKLYLFLTRENLELFRTQARQFAVQQ